MQREAAGEKKEEKKPDEALTLIYQNLEDRMKSVMGTKVSIHNKDKIKAELKSNIILKRNWKESWK